VRRRSSGLLLLLACVTLTLPARASAHTRSATVALDYKLVLDERQPSGVSVSILDGDRSLRISSPTRDVLVGGDLGEPMLRFDVSGVWGNRASITAVAEKLVAPGAGWQHLANGSTYTWHEHRLAPPPWQSTTGAIAQFDIPVTIDGRRTRISGTFVRYARPALWPWLVGAAALSAIVAAALRLGRPVTALLGSLAGFAAVVSLVAFAAADAPNGRVAWFQIVLAVAVATAMYVLLVRSHGSRRSAVAGLLGGAAAAVSLGSLGVFRHGVVVSALPATVSRALVELALVCGVAAALTSLRRESLR
jgi:hypothetical protein